VVLRVRVPTAKPLVYELDDNLRATRSYFVGPQKQTLWRRTTGALR
jgi:hypothetical protein